MGREGAENGSGAGGEGIGRGGTRRDGKGSERRSVARSAADRAVAVHGADENGRRMTRRETISGPAINLRARHGSPCPRAGFASPMTSRSRWLD